MTVAKHDMCHSGALKPIMHTEWDFFSPRWINAFARLRTWKSKCWKKVKIILSSFLLTDLFLILCKCPLHPFSVPLHGKGSSIWHLWFCHWTNSKNFSKFKSNQNLLPAPLCSVALSKQTWSGRKKMGGWDGHGSVHRELSFEGRKKNPH